MRALPALLAFLAAAPALAAERAALTLTPVCEGDQAVALDVELVARLDGKPVFRLPDVVQGTAGQAGLIENVSLRDGKGAVKLRRLPGADLELRARRAVRGPVTLRYRARSLPTTGPGARFGLRHDPTGIGGAGEFFLALPETRSRFALHAEWRPADCAPLGFVPTLPAEGSLDALRDAAYFAGRPRVFEHDGLRAVWFGTPAFDPAEASAWAARVLAAWRGTFADDEAGLYHMFVRVMPGLGEAANGTGKSTSFLSAIGPATPFGPRLRSNIAHEMLHRWMGLRLRIAGREGTGYWFSEGFTVHLTARLLYRHKLVARQETLDELNGIATRHFANPRLDATNEQIADGFFTDEALSVLPYTRGALYAAELDVAIAAGSKGNRWLGDLVHDLYQRGGEITLADFRAALAREVPLSLVARFDSVILHGQAPDLPDLAYGHCFRREKRRIRRFELGFDERSTREGGWIAGLQPGSPAERAGLRAGDELVDLGYRFLFPDVEAVVRVRRDGQELAVRYLPGAEERDGFAWTLDPRCR